MEDALELCNIGRIIPASTCSLMQSEASRATEMGPLIGSEEQTLRWLSPSPAKALNLHARNVLLREQP
jgi:hypothetical protein